MVGVRDHILNFCETPTGTLPMILPIWAQLSFPGMLQCTWTMICVSWECHVLESTFYSCTLMYVVFKKSSIIPFILKFWTKTKRMKCWEDNLSRKTIQFFFNMGFKTIFSSECFYTWIRTLSPVPNFQTLSSPAPPPPPPACSLSMHWQWKRLLTSPQKTTNWGMPL